MPPIALQKVVKRTPKQGLLQCGWRHIGKPFKNNEPFIMKLFRINIVFTAVFAAVACVAVGRMPAAGLQVRQAESAVNGSMASYVQYAKSDSLKVVRLLESARVLPENTNVAIFFARKLLGLPYVAHTLEVNKRERLVVNLRQLDCTTYVENVVALTMCVKQKAYTFNAFCGNLRTIRYRGGSAPHYTKRLHYFTDWIEDNTAKGVCCEIQAPVPPFTVVQDINVYYMSTYPEKYKMLKDNPEYVPRIAETEKALNKKSFRYIPKSAVKNTARLRAAVKDGDILALTTTLKGLDIQHIGFAVWHDDGLHLLNASSLRHKVVEEPLTLYAYLQRQRTMTGVRVVRLSCL